MSHHQIIKIIKNLIALSKSPFPNEAANALEKARKWMLKYNIDESELSGSVEDILEINFDLAYSTRKYSLHFAYWIGEAFFVQAFQVSKPIDNKLNFESVVRFIGKTSDVAVSTYIYAYVLQTLDRCATEYIKKSKKKSSKEDYCIGYIDAVCLKLQALKAEADAKLTPTETSAINTLMVIKNSLIEQYIKEKYGDSPFDGNQQTVKTDIDAYTTGYLQGEKQGLYRGVEDNLTKKRKELQ